MKNHEKRQLRVQRILLLVGGVGYLNWWLFVHLLLPNAFNPFGSRAAVCASFFLVFGGSYVSTAVARHLDAWSTACCCLVTAHYFYLFDRNEGELNWVVGAYIMVTAVCAIMQTARSLVVYSLFTAALSAVVLVRHPGVAFDVFLPGMLTTLLFANVGLQSRFRLLERLKESHSRIESLFDAGFDGIVVHEKGVIRQVNGALGGMLGYTKEELARLELPALFAQSNSKIAAEMVDGKRGGPYEAEVLRKDGSCLIVEVLAKKDLVGGREMQLVAFRDLTERRRAEMALLRVNRDLESFSYSVAHDLRTPLRAINGFSSILIEDYGAKLDDEGRRSLGRIATAAETMGRLIDALLGLAQLTKKEVDRDKVDLSEQANSIAQQLRSMQPERIVEFESQSGVIAYGDSQLLRALLDNLLRNAWKFTERKPAAHITFGTTVRDGDTVYYVKDDGAGFDMTHSSKLFGPFQRLHNASEFPGTGIGLATVHRIVDRHGGRVWAEGVVNEGATFYFTLPR